MPAATVPSGQMAAALGYGAVGYRCATVRSDVRKAWWKYGAPEGTITWLPSGVIAMSLTKPPARPNASWSSSEVARNRTRRPALQPVSPAITMSGCDGTASSMGGDGLGRGVDDGDPVALAGSDV